MFIFRILCSGLGLRCECTVRAGLCTVYKIDNHLHYFFYHTKPYYTISYPVPSFTLFYYTRLDINSIKLHLYHILCQQVETAQYQRSSYFQIQKTLSSSNSALFRVVEKKQCIKETERSRQKHRAVLT